MADENTNPETDEVVEDETAPVETDEKPAEDGKVEAKAKTKPVVAYKPPTESEWKAQQEKTKRANAQAAAHRREADELKRKSETDDEAKVRETREAVTAEVEKLWRPRYVNQAARTALTEAGVIGPVDKVLKLIDVEQVEIDDDGTIEGLDVQVRDIKRDYPALFGKRSSARVDGSDRGKDDNTTGGMSTASRKLLAGWG
jgi:hypothetical protein